MPSEILENISLYCLISLAYFRLLFKLSLIRSSTTRGSGTSILSRWSLQKLLRLSNLRLISTERVQSCFIHVFINTGSLYTRGFSVYTSPFLNTDEPKMALRAREVPGHGGPCKNYYVFQTSV